MTRLVSIIIPVFNEEQTIEKILKQVINQSIPGWKKEIIVVNDGSTDFTKYQIAKFKKKIIYIENRKNYGKGFAIRTALKKAKGEATLIQDADLEYSPKDYPLLLKAYNKYAVVYGSRHLVKKEKRGYPFFFWGGKFLTFLVNLFYNANLTDINSGYKLFNTRLIKSLNLKASRFEFCEEVTVKLLKKKIKIMEVPISYKPRSYKEGKKLSTKDGLTGLWTIIAECLR